MAENEQIKILMPVVKTKEKAFFPSSAKPISVDDFEGMSMSEIEKLVTKFENFELDEIELHVKGVAKTGRLTELVVGVSGEAGVKLKLKKKN
ncbi:hypothetical protein CHH77_02420 [Shouchella clausii]|uniref:hypothetical protein n=1 Tax=Shouchella clausii TaxID=79880 RepID=UPI000BA67C82|nr:hypothetical protein [Shouchella clausii]PAE84991.1 hypothetical protein CHH77_02420 [Shouchella clausii]